MKLVCVKCNVELKVKTNDVAVIRIHANPPTPWQIWNADLLACPICGIEIVSGFGQYSISELGITEDFSAAVRRCLLRPHIIRSYESSDDAARLRALPLEEI